MVWWQLPVLTEPSTPALFLLPFSLPTEGPPFGVVTTLLAAFSPSADSESHFQGPGQSMAPDGGGRRQWESDGAPPFCRAPWEAAARLVVLKLGRGWLPQGLPWGTSAP